MDRVESEIREALSEFGELSIEGNIGTLNPGDDFKLSQFFQLLESKAVPYHRFQIRQPSLETLFLHLTGKELRE